MITDMQTSDIFNSIFSGLSKQSFTLCIKEEEMSMFRKFAIEFKKYLTLSSTANLLIEVVNSIARNIVADSVNELPSTLKVAKVIKVVGTTSTEEPDLNITMVNEKFEITYTATDLAGNSKTIFVTLNKHGA